MGAQQSQPGNMAQQPQFNKANYEITLGKLIQYIELNRNRKIEELQKQDGQLKKIFASNQTNAENVKATGSDCVVAMKYIKGSNIVLRNLRILKEQSINIETSVKQREQLSSELLPLIHTIIWSKKRLNLMQIQEFIQLFMLYFDPNIQQVVETSPMVDLELKNYFGNLLPGPLEIQDYLKKF